MERGELADLTAFVAVAEHLSFRGAAARLGVTQIATALEDLNEERQRPFGRLRIRVSHMAAAAVVAPVWGRFLTAYPDVHLEIHAGAAPRDDTARGFDAGIGPREWASADMVTVRVTDRSRWRSWAARAISRAGRRPRPRTIWPGIAAFNNSRI
jgi:DNA-binding transcriptional LysR family regulator